MTGPNLKVDQYLRKHTRWRAEIAQLRTIILDCRLKEALKWGVPCYTFQDRNIVLIHVFKEYCAVLFFKGALLNDAKGILVQQTANTQAARQIRFTRVQEIAKMKQVLKAYIREAIECEKAGSKVEFKKTTEFAIPKEFHDKLHEFNALKVAFEGLTPGRQRAYLLYFSDAKQSKTRASRVDRSVRRILEGRGLDD